MTTIELKRQFLTKCSNLRLSKQLVTDVAKTPTRSQVISQPPIFRLLKNK